MSDGAQASAARPALADERRWLLLVLAVAFMLRAGLAFGLQAWLDDSVGRRFLIAGDADGYWELGRRLASGDEYSLYNPPRHVLRMPGFPALLAVAIRLVPGRPELAARLGELIRASPRAEKQFRAVLYKFCYGYSDNEIAESLGTDVANVHVLRSRGLKRLRKDPILRKMAREFLG